jgi:hypothetical protein
MNDMRSVFIFLESSHMKLRTVEGVTIPQIIEALGWPAHRVRYFIASKKMQEELRIGHCRLFSKEQMETIRAGLESMDMNRSKYARKVPAPNPRFAAGSSV